MQYAALVAAKTLRASPPPAGGGGGGTAVTVEVLLPFPVLHGLGNGLGGSDQVSAKLIRESVVPCLAARRLRAPRAQTHRQSVLVEAPGGGGDVPVSLALRGTPNVGVAFVEDTAFLNGDGAAARAAAFDALVTGSVWTEQALRAAVGGSTRVVLAHQGVEQSLYGWRPRPRPVRGRPFTVFSGGKLEFRKGQARARHRRRRQRRRLGRAQH